MGRRIALDAAHRQLGARMVEFAGWDMPVSYAGAVDEHAAVRGHCGLFDVSHMGEVEIRGPGALALCQALTVNDVTRLQDGDGQYSVLCNDQGGVIDDLVLFRLASDRWLLVVNAANTEADLAWIGRHAGADVVVDDRSADTALFALQGPLAERALRTLTAIDLPAMSPFTLRAGPVAGVDGFVSRTGYTGEDGFELFVPAGGAQPVWDALLAAVRRCGGQPCGLAARDTLRLEAGLPLCGTDMDGATTPLEAGIGWVVKLRKPAFVGRDALMRQAGQGLTRRLVGLLMEEPGIPRHGYVVSHAGAPVGVVTSGTKSPTLGAFIGMAYVHSTLAEPGTAVSVEIRQRQVPARVIDRPFYRRPQSGVSHATA